MSTKIKEKKYFCEINMPFNLDKHVGTFIWLSSAHIIGFYGFYLALTGQIPWRVTLFYYCYGMFSGLGVTAGCHRYWAHKTFEAKLPLQILLAYLQTSMFQFTIFSWCRDHRVHHKYTETDSDPCDARKGFWFSHVGWLLMKEHPSVKEKANAIDLSDLDNDPVVRFQAKYYWYLAFISAGVVPISVTSFIFPELTFFQLICGNYMLHITGMNFTFLINSAAHKWGYKPCDKNLGGFNNRVLEYFVPLGEGWHNYHHTFPWDYKSDGLGFYKFNVTTYFINFCSWIGLAYNLKTVPENVVRDRVNRTGDGTHALSEGMEGSSIRRRNKLDGNKVLPPWGWGDEAIPDEHFQITKILHPTKAA